MSEKPTSFKRFFLSYSNCNLLLFSSKEVELKFFWEMTLTQSSTEKNNVPKKKTARPASRPLLTVFDHLFRLLDPLLKVQLSNSRQCRECFRIVVWRCPCSQPGRHPPASRGQSTILCPQSEHTQHWGWRGWRVWWSQFPQTFLQLTHTHAHFHQRKNIFSQTLFPWLIISSFTVTTAEKIKGMDFGSV